MKSAMKSTAACAVLALAWPLGGQVATQANARYQTVEGRKAVAAGLEAPGREERHKPQDLVRAMGLRPGMTVVDVGTGVGYMLPFLSHAVGAVGRVIAEDTFDEYLAAARIRTANQQLTNVTFVKGTDQDLSLPEASADAVLVLDAYRHFDYPQEMLAGIHKALKPSGKLVIVEYYKTPAAMPNGDDVNHIRLNKPDVIKEIEANRFRLGSERE